MVYPRLWHTCNRLQHTQAGDMSHLAGGLCQLGCPKIVLDHCVNFI